MTVEAVVFDIGNVLIRWDPEGFYDRKIGSDRRRQLFAEADLTGMNATIDLGADLRGAVRDLAAQHPDWADEIQMWHDNWLEMASPAIDPSVRLLRALRRKGVPVYALSNFGRETFRLAETNFPFLEEFDGRVLSGELGVAKPDPAIYAALEQMAGVTPDALLFTDDVAVNIAAAEARGWQVHLFDGPRDWAARLVRAGLLSESEAA